MIRETLYTIGLDLGQVRDFTALGVLETAIWVSGSLLREYPWRDVTADAWNSPATMRAEALDHVLTRDDSRWPGKPPLALKHLDRMRDVSYPAVVAHVAALMAQPPLAGNCMLVVDATGVGAPVVDMFRQAGLRPVSVIIHGGDAVGHKGLDYRVPKRDLVAAVQSTLQTRRLQVLASLPLADVLVKELSTFKVKIDPATAHDSYSAWREADHDDLVLAVALAAWWRDFYWRNYDRARLTRGEAVAV